MDRGGFGRPAGVFAGLDSSFEPSCQGERRSGDPERILAGFC